MTREEFKTKFGEDPVDMFGQDWENEIDRINQEEEEAMARMDAQDAEQARRDAYYQANESLI